MRLRGTLLTPSQCHDWKPLNRAASSHYGGAGLTNATPLGVVLAAELRHLGRALVPGFLHDRRDLGIGGEVLPTVGVPVEDHPDAVVLIGVAEDERTLRP